MLGGAQKLSFFRADWGDEEVSSLAEVLPFATACTTLHLAHKLAMGRTADDVLPMVVDALVRAHAPAKGEKR